MFHPDTKQGILLFIELFTSQSLIQRYKILFKHLDLSHIEDKSPHKRGPKGYSKKAMIRALITFVTEPSIRTLVDLVNFLNNNRILAFYCGFDIRKKNSIPSARTFSRFLKTTPHSVFSNLFRQTVLQLKDLGLIKGETCAFDTTPIKANVKQNNPKTFVENKFDPANPPVNDKEATLGVIASNNKNSKNKKKEWYWGYKNGSLIDCFMGFPVAEVTTTCDHDTTFFDLLVFESECVVGFNYRNGIGDAGFDASYIHSYYYDKEGKAYIALNDRRRSEERKTSPNGHFICDDGREMKNWGTFRDGNRRRRKEYCPILRSKKALASGEVCRCNHPNWQKRTGCTKYLELNGDSVRFFMDRKSTEYKEMFKLRTHCERINSITKSRGMENPTMKGLRSNRNLATLHYIAINAVGIAYAESGIVDRVFSFKNLSRAIRPVAV